VDAVFAPARLLSLRTRGSAAYKGIYALLLREGARDVRTGEPSNVQNYFDERIDPGLPGEPEDEPADYEVIDGYDDLEGDLV